MRTVIGILALTGLVTAQVIEQRSSVRNPDGSTSQSQSRSYSEATYSGSQTGSDGITTGFDVRQDSHGKVTGSEWRADGDKKLETRKIVGEAGGIGGRTALGGFGGVGSGLGSFGTGFGSPGFGSGSNFGSTGFGSGSNYGTPGFGAGTHDFTGLPSGGLPWANFGNFGRQFASPGFGQIPQFNFANFGFQQPLAVPNYSKFLLGGVGFNPNIASDGHFGNVIPRIGVIDPGFGGSSNFGGPGGFGAGSFGPGGFGLGGRGTHKTEVDPTTGKRTYTYSYSEGKQS